mmetsp:Transcript_5994/g.11825  ORF Transcript_5994/g.11825 Transcript_5994/m.11825 type:complete len:90 (-) Transcript_5994:151-420(-)
MPWCVDCPGLACYREEVEGLDQNKLHLTPEQGRGGRTEQTMRPIELVMMRCWTSESEAGGKVSASLLFVGSDALYKASDPRLRKQTTPP